MESTPQREPENTQKDGGNGGKKQSTITTKRPTHKQAVILKTKQEHPNLTTREIAAIAETDHTHVIKTLQRYGIERVYVDRYKHHRADILAGMQERLINSITVSDIKKAPMRDKVVSVGILYDKERLERDLSTANVTNIFADLEALREAHYDT